MTRERWASNLRDPQAATSIVPASFPRRARVGVSRGVAATILRPPRDPCARRYAFVRRAKSLLFVIRGPPTSVHSTRTACVRDATARGQKKNQNDRDAGPLMLQPILAAELWAIQLGSACGFVRTTERPSVADDGATDGGDGWSGHGAPAMNVHICVTQIPLGR